MRLLILQILPATRGRPVPRFEPQLGTLLTLLEQRGHELTLVGLSSFDVAAIKAGMSRGLPQLVYADISPVCTDAARRTFEHIQRNEFVPIVVGGALAVVDPAGCLSLPGVHAAAIGEPDASLVTYFERVRDPAVGQVVRGVWLRDEKGLARPQMPPLVEDLDSLPLPNRDLFNYAEHVRRTGEIEIAVGRGCPQKCGYCLNPAAERLYAGGGAWVRRRSPRHVVDEIKLLREKYGDVRRVRFLDHAFALDAVWLEPMLALYREQVGLPFRCHVRLNAIERGRIAAMRAAGCDSVSVEVISASNFVRNDIMHMELSSEQIAGAFQVLHAHGLETRAILYLGTPYESETSLREAVQLLRRLRPTIVDVRPYYPLPGTAAADLARASGWLHTRGEEQFHAQRCGIDMPSCRESNVAAAIRQISREFRVQVGEPWWRAAVRSVLGGRR
ncbi:MAG: B12-binding domain-containing radical SAM protein [Phycisphaerae bacterium]